MQKCSIDWEISSATYPYICSGLNMLTLWCWNRNIPGEIGIGPCYGCCLSVPEHIEAETNGRHFADDIFKCIFLNENVWISLKMSLKFAPRGPINNIPAMVQIMAWRRPGDKPLSEPMLVSLLTHICVSRPQWVKSSGNHRWTNHCF